MSQLESRKIRYCFRFSNILEIKIDNKLLNLMGMGQMNIRITEGRPVLCTQGVGNREGI